MYKISIIKILIEIECNKKTIVQIKLYGMSYLIIEFVNNYQISIHQSFHLNMSKIIIHAFIFNHKNLIIA